MNFFEVKPKIYFGENSLEHIKSLNFKRVCIATDKFMVNSGILNNLLDILNANNITYHIFSDITPDPNTEIVKKGLVHIVNLKPDGLIAFGGGSVIDAAKAIMYYCIKLKEEFIEHDLISKPYFIAIPTTAGTGSEATAFSVITDLEKDVKYPIVNSLMLPDEAILDPNLTLLLPKNMTAATGMDVLTHGIESFISTNSNDFSRMYALNSIKLLYNNLILCCNDLNNIKYRLNLQVASSMAGIAFNSSGLGITHSIAHAIGAKFHIPHGLANAIILPYVIEFNGQNTLVKDRYIDILKTIGFDINDSTDVSYLLKLTIEKLNEYLSIPKSFNALSVDKEEFYSCLDDITTKALNDICTSTNPEFVDFNKLKNLIISIY
ncbi:MAG: 1-propanol dehydrogenase PduQ [Peptostreptococcaceae bacterium]